MANRPNKLPAPKKLLVRCPNWLGDAVMATPALTGLREALPETEIVVLTRENLADLYRGHPAANSAVTFRKGDSLWPLARRLRAERFDAALLLTNSHRSALEVWLAGIPFRMGLRVPFRSLLLSRSIGPRDGHVRMRKLSAHEVQERIAIAKFTTETQRHREQPESDGQNGARAGATAHQVYDYLHLASRFCGRDLSPVAPALSIGPEEALSALSRFGIPAAECLVGVCPGAEYGPAKRWPAENFVAAALAVHRELPARWIVLGTAKDLPLCNSVTAAINKAAPASAQCLAGQTSLRELMCVLKSCRAVLTNDTGSMHLAAALGTPVAAIFGSTSPELTGPFPLGTTRHAVLRHAAPCAPCFLRECPIDYRCLNGIKPEEAASALLEMLRPASP